MTKVVLYLRASSPEQNTDIQRHLCNKYIAEKGYEVVQVIDEKISGYRNTERRQIFKFIQDLAEPCFEKLIIYAYDRFSRNIIDGLEMIHALEEKGVTVESVIDNIDYTTPDGRKRLAEKFVVAQYESDLISHRVNMSINYRRNFGCYIGPVPYGKRLEPIHRKDMINNDEEAKVMEFIAYAKRGGVTSDRLTEMINKIKQQEPDEIIGTFDADNNLIEPTHPMSNREISDILNDCNIKKRKRSWTPDIVAKTAKRVRVIS